jgi:hypothetical protein
MTPEEAFDAAMRYMTRAGDDAVGAPPACGGRSDVGVPPACGGEERRHDPGRSF